MDVDQTEAVGSADRDIIRKCRPGQLRLECGASPPDLGESTGMHNGSADAAGPGLFDRGDRPVCTNGNINRVRYMRQRGERRVTGEAQHPLVLWVDGENLAAESDLQQVLDRVAAVAKAFGGANYGH